MKQKNLSIQRCWLGNCGVFQDEMLERRMVAGAVAYSAVFLADQVKVSLKDTTVKLGTVNRNTEISIFIHFHLQRLIRVERCIAYNMSCNSTLSKELKISKESVPILAQDHSDTFSDVWRSQPRMVKGNDGNRRSSDFLGSETVTR